MRNSSLDFRIVSAAPFLRCRQPAGIVSVNTVPGGEQARYRISFNVGVQNLGNRVNRVGYNGTMTSPFFRQSTGVGQPRKIDLGVVR